jgi:hypothetical protein
VLQGICPSTGNGKINNLFCCGCGNGKTNGRDGCGSGKGKMSGGKLGCSRVKLLYWELVYCVGGFVATVRPKVATPAVPASNAAQTASPIGAGPSATTRPKHTKMGKIGSRPDGSV